MVSQMASTSPEFRFSSYSTAPSSPKAFGNPDDCFCYTSAPTSPTRAAAVYSHLARDIDHWKEEEEYMSQKFVKDFEFGLGLNGQKDLTKADEITDKGRINPSSTSSTLPPKSLHERRKERDLVPPPTRETRDLSPFRGDRGPSFSKTSISSPTSNSASSTTKRGSKKWRLKDLLLFRSASEGRATGRGSKDPLQKYTMLSSSFNKRTQDKNFVGSSRSLDNSNSSIKRGSSGHAISAHELHYTENRAASEELKKKTPLPFNRNGLFGCLHFNPAVRSISRGFNSYSFNQNR